MNVYCRQVGLLLLIASLCGCAQTSRDDQRIRIIASYCETAAFERTDLAVQRQITVLPPPVKKSLQVLRDSGTTKHAKYLSYLLLRDYEYQMRQFGGGYSLGPGLPPLVLQELDRVLGQVAGLSGGSDRTSATYAATILRNPRLFAMYPKGQALVEHIRQLQPGGVTSHQ